MKQSQPMLKPKISIIIPVYNVKDFLRRCLDSVKKQMTEDVEVVIVDDGSIDGSTEILKEYYDNERWNFFRTDKNRGLSFARNEGIAHSCGEYLYFLDSDDELCKDAVKNMIDAMKLNKDVIQFNHMRHYAPINKTVVKYKNRAGKYSLYKRPLLWGFATNKLFRRAFINEKGISFKEGLRFGEDEPFVLKCLLNDASFYCVDGCTMIRHFDNKNSICHTTTPRAVHEQDEYYIDIFWSLKYRGFPQKKVDEVERIIRERRKEGLYQDIGLKRREK